MAQKSTAQKKDKDREKDKIERRRSPRKDVLDTFHVFMAIRKKGLRKIYLRDLSLTGVGLLVEPDDSFRQGETLDCEFYINPSLKFPLRVKVAHVTGSIAGCDFVETETPAYRAYSSFVGLLEQLTRFVD